jgi:hypothetical protein
MPYRAPEAASPCSTTQVATCVREPSPSLARMCSTCVSAVRSAMNSASAIWRLVGRVRSARPPRSHAG